MSKYMTDIFDMHLSNKKNLKKAVMQLAEDCVENNEDESTQLSVMIDCLGTLYDALTIKHPEYGCFHNEVLNAAKGQINYLELARKYIAQYKDGGM